MARPDPAKRTLVKWVLGKLRSQDSETVLAALGIVEHVPWLARSPSVSGTMGALLAQHADTQLGERIAFTVAVLCEAVHHAWTANAEAGLQSSNEEVRGYVCDALQYAPTPACAPLLAQLTKDESEEVRYSAYVALAVIENGLGPAQVKRGLQDSSWYVRQGVLLALLKMIDRGFVAKLAAKRLIVQHLSVESDVAVKLDCWSIMYTRLGVRTALDEVLEVLRNGEEDVRCDASAVLSCALCLENARAIRHAFSLAVARKGVPQRIVKEAGIVEERIRLLLSTTDPKFHAARACTWGAMLLSR